MERTCGPEEWTCKSKNGQCIPNAWVCDDHEDCDDKSDEEVCSKYISTRSNIHLISSKFLWNSDPEIVWYYFATYATYR